MQNTMNVVLSHVFNTVPYPILELGASIARRYGKRVNNVQELILQSVIRERVLLRCNLVGGLMKSIVMKSSWIEKGVPEQTLFSDTDGNCSIYRVPPEARDNRFICNVLSVSFPYYGTTSVPSSFSFQGGFSVPLAMNLMLNSYTGMGVPNHPLGFLLSGDLIKISPPQTMHQDWNVMVRLAFDEYFESLHSSAVDTLCRITEAATKAMIYNSAIVELDRAAMEFGADIGAIKNVIESYSDANQRFEELMTEWKGVQNIDPEFRATLAMYQL